MIFSRHRRKLEPHRRFGSPIFRAKLKQQASHKRMFGGSQSGIARKLVTIFSWRSKLFRGGLILTLLLVAHYLVISDRFLITEVAVAGNNQVRQEQIQEVVDSLSSSRWMLIRKNHYLLMTQGRINRELTTRISDIKEVVNTNRKGWHKIEIEIKERNPGFVFLVQGKKFLVDEEGSVVKEIAAPGGTEVPLHTDLLEVENQVSEDVVVGELLPNPKLIAFILSMHKSWPSKVTSNLVSVKVPGKGSSEVQFGSSEGWIVFFDTNRSVSNQLGSLAVILNKQLTAQDRTRLAYIDMRSEKWIYYCYRGAPCNAQPNE